MWLRTGVLILLLFAGAWFFVTGRGLDSPAASPQISHEPEEPSAAPLVEAPEKTRSPAAAPPQRLTRDQMVRVIREDRYCTGQEYTLPNHAFPSSWERIQFVYEAMTAAADGEPTDPCLQALIRRDRAEIIRLSATSSAVACRFILALTLTGQMSSGGEDSPQTAEENGRGVQILRDLQHEDTANGIYPFFLAGALSTADYTSETGEVIRSFLQTKRFDNPITTLWARAYELADLNATANLYTSEVVSSFNFPFYSKGARAIKDYVANVATVDTSDTTGWMENLVHYIKKIDAERIHEPFVSLADLGTMRGLATNFWLTAGRKEADLPEALTDEWYRGFFRRVSRLDESEFFPMEDSGCVALHQSIKSQHASSMAIFWDEKRRFERAFR